MRWVFGWGAGLLRGMVAREVCEQLAARDADLQAYARDMVRGQAGAMGGELADVKRRLAVLEAGLPRKIAKRVRKG